MDAIAYLQIQFSVLRRQYSMALQDLTDEQINWTPPGTANPIGVTLLHTVSGEDMFLNRLILGQPTLWETQDWAKKIGVPTPPGGPRGWDEAKQARLELTPLMDFQEAVCEAISAYLNGLTPEALDRPVSAFGAERSTAELLAIVSCHSAEHLGEITCLKGVWSKQ